MLEIKDIIFDEKSGLVSFMRGRFIMSPDKLEASGQQTV